MKAHYIDAQRFLLLLFIGYAPLHGHSRLPSSASVGRLDNPKQGLHNWLHLVALRWAATNGIVIAIPNAVMLCGRTGVRAVGWGVIPLRPLVCHYTHGGYS